MKYTFLSQWDEPSPTESMQSIETHELDEIVNTFFYFLLSQGWSIEVIVGEFEKLIAPHKKKILANHKIQAKCPACADGTS